MSASMSFSTIPLPMIDSVSSLPCERAIRSISSAAGSVPLAAAISASDLPTSAGSGL